MVRHGNDPKQILKVDRSKPFDPSFVGKGWIIDEQDERALALEEINLTQASFETTLNPNESYVQGEEKLRRLKKMNQVRLDAKVFPTLWENKHLIPKSWKTKGYIYFDGTVLRSPYGHRSVLYLCWRDGGWRWGCHWLEGSWRSHEPSAVIASS